MKRCPRCGTEKPRDDFSRRKNTRDGRHPWCRRCNASSCKAYRAANPDKAKARNVTYRKAHREEGIVRSAKWRQENPDQFRARRNAWLAANIERHRASHKAWRLANKEYLRQKKTEWAAANREHKASLDRNRRARLRAAEGSHTHIEIKALAVRQKFRCANPMCRCSIKKDWHTDHIMPLDLGGSNWIRNIQLLCPFCNISKHAKHPVVWAQKNGLLL